MIAAYSPQARGRSERNFGTWQSRLPQELRSGRDHQRWRRPTVSAGAAISTSSTDKFTVAAAGARNGVSGRAAGRTWSWVFIVQTERVVDKDNTVAIGNRWWQIDKIAIATQSGRNRR